MVTFETNPYLRETYLKLVDKYIYPLVKSHRNAWFNMAYLNMMHVNDSNIQRDIEDQLMRFDVERIPGQKNSTRIPERGLNTSGYTYKLIPDNWPRTSFKEWLKNHSLYPSLEVNVLTRLFNAGQEYLKKPKTVEYYQNADFLWQRTPWEESSTSMAARQDSGLAFLLPYYMGRYQGFIKDGES